VRGGAVFPVRLRYTKRGKVRWISHRDVARAMERAFRITQLPLAFSEGFSPHPKVSFGLALSTGHESDAEYLDVELAQPIELSTLPAQLSAALPEGIDVVDAAVLADQAPALQEAVTAVEWQVVVAHASGAAADPAGVREQVVAALALPALPTLRTRKGRDVVEDVRPVIRRITVADALPVTVTMELSTHPRSAKPHEVLAALAEAVGAPDPLVEAGALRTNQWIERDGARWEPLDADTREHATTARAS
jgi:radical SAM-linked protein